MAKKPDEKKELNTPIHIRLSSSDRADAVLYNERFQTEASKVIKQWRGDALAFKKKLAAMARRWGVSELRYDPHSRGLSVILKRPVEVLPHKAAKMYVGEKSKPIEVKELRTSLGAYMAGPGKGKKNVLYADLTPELVDGRYLILKLDLWATKRKLLAEVETQLDLYRKHIELPKGRMGKTTYDPWRVYSLKKAGKTYKEIVKIIDPFLQHKTVPQIAIDNARKACLKARTMIDAATPTGR